MNKIAHKDIHKIGKWKIHLLFLVPSIIFYYFLLVEKKLIPGYDCCFVQTYIKVNKIMNQIRKEAFCLHIFLFRWLSKHDQLDSLTLIIQFIIFATKRNSAKYCCYKQDFEAL